ncbi:porin [Flavobacterium sp. SM2513]|uniref:porin n=1 Tax=Flavobacterium sp. SM2513 TaxID=3424766 RepID=UPI003D7FAFB0
MKRFLLLVMLFIFWNNQAQVSIKKSTENNDLKLSSLPYYNYGKGLGLTSPDSLFQFNIRFRMQNRVSYYDTEGEKPTYDGQIRRLRLRFDGYVGNPKFLYAIQLSFAPGDVGELQEGQNINIIRDAVVFYRPNKHWNFSFGQTKLPGNRQRINSSGALQLTDRSINNAKFTIDRDFGIQIHNLNEFEEKFSYNFKGAISTGEGRNITDKADDGVALTGKVELFPLGAFKNNGSFFEGDLSREARPKLMLSGAFQQNNNSQRTQGQLGATLFEKRTTQAVFLDAMVKYNGWSLMSSYMSRSASDNALTFNPADATDFNYVYVGNGFDYQASYLFESDYEVIGRYSLQHVGPEIHQFTPHVKQYSLGLTKYIWEHTFKLQTEVTYESSNYFGNQSVNDWYLRFQVEIGI